MGESVVAVVVFDIDGVVRDVSGSYRRALADTVEQFTAGQYRPSSQEIDALKGEGVWNNDWEASQELIYRYFEAQGQGRDQLNLDYGAIVQFFQSRYRGTDPINWTGYICQEPLLLSSDYLNQLSEAGIQWGFFSGATQGSARYVLERRIGLESPVLIAMEDAPGKPDPTGLFLTLERLEDEGDPVLYVGDTVADMYTIVEARKVYPERSWIGVGVLPPHVQETGARSIAYGETLRQAGAAIVLSNVKELTPEVVKQLITQS
ncbi:TIGR01548 family HAD-type hydrolase [Leptolyngbya sp. FACHB-17]|uniref:TIGR01548 family HAD-type hydrolase n=1 Tax=unclassified Leptolyngbya TaxID=2650499 RepID=UPI001680B18F|nr:TIGR01548 family HAD-type hydrolase [Leptolyngbya sp. FACHB-17]